MDQQGLRHFADTTSSGDLSLLLFQRLGTSHGGLNWKDVQPLMEQFLRNLEVEIVICLDTLPYAEGVEGDAEILECCAGGGADLQRAVISSAAEA